MAPQPQSDADLPHTLPVFPLSGVMLLPGMLLPLNIFEPRYLDMVRDSLAGHQLIGMVQPESGAAGPSAAPQLYRTACAGYITEHSHTDDGRILITLKGVSRFEILKELSVTTKYRQVIAGWGKYSGDLAISAEPPDEDSEKNHAPAESGIDRSRLLSALKTYLALHQLKADWGNVEKAPSDKLINMLAMSCPFSDSEKQALLEAADVGERSQVMVALFEMAILQKSHGDIDPKVH